MPDAMQALFAGYAGGSKVEGLIALQQGIRVGYDDGRTVMFYAVPEGKGLAFIDGEFKVVDGDDTAA